MGIPPEPPPLVDRLYVYWCPECRIQSATRWHTIKGRRPSEGAAAQHTCEKIEVVPITAAAERIVWIRRREEELARALSRAVSVAEHLMEMISRETWRATGGDDGQGHYEGDSRQEQIAEEIDGWKALAEEKTAKRRKR